MILFRKHSERFDWFATRAGRVGFCARGFLWASIGGVAITAAVKNDHAQGPTGALDVVAQSNGGFVVLIIATIGMVCYALWRLFEGIYGLRVDPRAKAGMKIINGYVVPFASAMIYISYAVSNTIALVNGRRGNNNDIAAKLIKHTIGKIFLQIAAIILFGVALGWLVMLVQRKFKDGLDRSKFDKLPKWAKVIFYSAAIIGTIGRVALFGLLAVLFSRIVYDSDLQFGGFGEALDQILINRAGKAFVVIIGIFLIIFGSWSIMMAAFKEFLPYKPRFHHPTEMNVMRTLPEETKTEKEEKAQMHFPFLHIAAQ
jgi:flagellar biogenesis protein FliO